MKIRKMDEEFCACSGVTRFWDEMNSCCIPEEMTVLPVSDILHFNTGRKCDKISLYAGRIRFGDDKDDRRENGGQTNEHAAEEREDL